MGLFVAVFSPDLAITCPMVGHVLNHIDASASDAKAKNPGLKPLSVTGRTRTSRSRGTDSINQSGLRRLFGQTESYSQASREVQLRQCLQPPERRDRLN